MSAHEKAPTTAKQTGAFKTNLSLNFNRAIRTYNAIIFIAKRVAYDMLPLVAIYGVFIAGVLVGGLK
jgi:hypothetical protein